MLPYQEKFKSLTEEIFRRTTAIEATDKEEVMYKGLVCFFFVKGLKTFRSIQLLCGNNFAEDAAILTRSLFEMFVDLLYISADPSSRARLFLEYSYVQRKTLHDRIAKDATDPWSEKLKKSIESEAVIDLSENYERVKKHYPKKYLWSGKTTKQMAAEVNLAFHYNYIYWLTTVRLTEPLCVTTA